MSDADRKKWNQKYQDKPQLLALRDASDVVKDYISDEKGLKALDLACGTGRHAVYLAQKGYEVVAVDIAEAALEALCINAEANAVSEKITPKLMDLETHIFDVASYDLIVMTNFLDRALIQETKRSLKKGGLYIVETYMFDEENEKENSNASNLLNAGELREIFNDGFEEIYYGEYKNEDYELYRMKKQVIVAQKV